MIGDLLGAARDFGRLRDITAVLVRYGFADAARRMGMASVLERIGESLNVGEDQRLASLETRR